MHPLKKTLLRATLTLPFFAPVFAPVFADEPAPDAEAAEVIEAAPGIVAEGRAIGIRYTVTLADGTIADSNVDGTPLVYTQGAGQVLPALEARLDGMRVGDTARVELAAAEAYGEIDQESFKDIPADRIPEDSRQVGALLTATRIDGQAQQVRVAAVEGDNIVLDFNHPLAGKDLVFDVAIVSVESP